MVQKDIRQLEIIAQPIVVQQATIEDQEDQEQVQENFQGQVMTEQEQISITQEGQERVSMVQEIEGQATMEQEEQGQVSMAQEVQGQATIEQEEQGQVSTTQEVQEQATIEKEEQGQVSMTQEVQEQVTIEKEKQGQVSTAQEVQRQATIEEEEQGQVSTTQEVQGQVTIEQEEREQISMVQEVQGQVSIEIEEQGQVSTAQEVQGQATIEQEEQDQVSTTQKVQEQATIEKEEQGQVSTAQEVQRQVTIEKEEQSQISTAQKVQEQLSMGIEEEEQVSIEMEEQEQILMAQEIQGQVTMEQGQNISASTNCVSHESFVSLMTEYVSNVPLYNKNYCRTRISSSIFHYTWEIDRFSDILKMVKQLNSTPFPEIAQCMLSLDIHDISESEDSKSLTLYLLNSKEFTGLCSVSLNNASENIPKVTVTGLIPSKIVLCNISESVANWDKLTIECTIEVFHNLINDTIRNSLSTSGNLEITNFRTLTLNNNSHSDSNLDKKPIVFIISGEYFSMPLKLLRTINSDYFKNLYNEFQESGMLSKIELNENPIIFKEMLSYIKTGFIAKEHNFNMIKDLLMLAHKYDVQELKKLCEQHLIRRITKKNVVQLIKLAILYNAQYLESCTASFIKFYQKDIMDSKEYQFLPQHTLNKITESISKINIETATNHTF